MPYQISSLFDLREESLPDMNWAVNMLAPEGLSLLVGKQKLGKSFLALRIAMDVAMGKPVLGYIPVDGPKRVLYMALEDGKRRIKKRANLMLREGEEWPKNLDIAYHWRPIEKEGEGLEDLKEYVSDAHTAAQI